MGRAPSLTCPELGALWSCCRDPGGDGPIWVVDCLPPGPALGVRGEGGCAGQTGRRRPEELEKEGQSTVDDLLRTTGARPGIFRIIKHSQDNKSQRLGASSKQEEKRARGGSPGSSLAPWSWGATARAAGAGDLLPLHFCRLWGDCWST